MRTLLPGRTGLGAHSGKFATVSSACGSTARMYMGTLTVSGNGLHCASAPAHTLKMTTSPNHSQGSAAALSKRNSKCCPGPSSESRTGNCRGPQPLASNFSRAKDKPRLYTKTLKCLASTLRAAVPMSTNGASNSSHMCLFAIHVNCCKYLIAAASWRGSTDRRGAIGCTFHCGRQRISVARASLLKSSPELNFQKCTSRNAWCSISFTFFTLSKHRNLVSRRRRSRCDSLQRVRLPSSLLLSMGSEPPSMSATRRTNSA
mmetsp:Transcript_126517/g.354262  ORF Transcript_126517/g.354262 Transcript_126517/m.354262 type:complete len:260 (-) Transcript_126517:775-1554(-)